MEKVRVYELAKELNTTSKRLMEKLGEINVVVKNHMSLLEDDELTSLYKHIGIVKHDESKKEEAVSEDKRSAAATQHKTEPSKDVKDLKKEKDAKSAPRIIRKTEINMDSKPEVKENKPAPRPEFQRNDYRNDVRGDVRGPSRNNNQRNDYVKSADSNSGLMSGYRRDSGPDYRRDYKPAERQEASRGFDKSPAKVEIKLDTNQEPKVIDKNMQADSIKPEVSDVLKTSPVTNEDNKQDQQTEKVEPILDSGNAQVAAEPTKNTVEASPRIENRQPPRNNDYQQRPPRTDYQGGGNNYRPSAGPNDRPVQRQNYGPNDRPAFRPNNQQGDRPYENRQGARPQGDRPQGDRPQGDRPQGGYRPAGDRPQGSYNSYGDRPQGGYRPSGDRPQGDRPQGGYRPAGDRPQGTGFRPQGDRPQGGGYQSGGGYRPQGDRPQGDRPQGGYNSYGDRPQGTGFRPQGDRPQGGGGYRPQGDRPQGGYNSYGDRPQGGFRSGGSRPLDIPKPELSIAQKEEISAQRGEIRREFQNKDIDKDVKREQKREVPKGQTPVGKSNRFKPQRVNLSEKKGVSEVMSDDFILEEFYTNDGVKRTRRVSKPKKAADAKYIPPRAVLTSIKVPETITVKDLAEALKKTSTEVIKKLMTLGVMATLNHELDFDTATIIADEFGIKTEKEVVVNEEDILFDEADDKEEDLVERPPVVVVMGHVDHGKTSLLDAIRETNVIDSEAGGITQHIGAYTVKINHRIITFLDTPGHEAFTAMRARGAQVTDVAIIVVAADDGIMPQTIEAINHAKAAGVSIIVAINKIDKPGANIDKVKQELTEYGLVSEEWGGDTICVPVSAKKRLNIEHLLEMVLLAADVLELKTNPNRQAKGTIIEAKLDKGRGPVATVLVQRGTLNIGDSIVTGTSVGRIRAMADDKGHKAKKAGPSTPVEIIGLSEVPEAGEIFYAITDEKIARQLAEKRKNKQRELQLRSSAKVTLEDLYTQIIEGKVKDLNLIVKADVQGSVEAVKQSLEKLSNDQVRVKIIHGGVGAITESDVLLAGVSSAIIIGFNVRPGTNVAEAAEKNGVDIKLYRVIYNAIDDVQAAMKGMLEPTFKEVITGHTEVRQIFKVSNVGTIAGSYVTDGKIVRNSEVRVVRGGIVVHEGKLSSLKRFKDDAREVAQGFECGVSIEKFNDLRVGDIIESFSMEEVAR